MTPRLYHSLVLETWFILPNKLIYSLCLLFRNRRLSFSYILYYGLANVSVFPSDTKKLSKMVDYPQSVRERVFWTLSSGIKCSPLNGGCVEEEQFETCCCNQVQDGLWETLHSEEDSVIRNVIAAVNECSFKFIYSAPSLGKFGSGQLSDTDGLRLRFMLHYFFPSKCQSSSTHWDIVPLSCDGMNLGKFWKRTYLTLESVARDPAGQPKSKV